MRRKTRLTITLPTDLLSEVDKTIDRFTIRNRSHAIEHLLRTSISPRVHTAAVLVGAAKHTIKLPSLIQIDQQNLITLMIEHLKGYGIRDVVILAAENESEIRKSLRVGKDLGVSIHYVREPKPMGTAGALKYAQKQLQGGPFLVLHGDILTDIAIDDFIYFHTAEHTLATIAVKPRSSEDKYGQVILQGNTITNFFEKDQGQGISIVNTGVYILEPEVLSLIPTGVPTKLETAVFPKLASMGQLSAFFFQGIWFDVSKPSRYDEAKRRWEQTHRVPLVSYRREGVN